MKRVINIPFRIQSNENEPGEIIIHGKRIASYISKKAVFPGFLKLYNWHELCYVTKVYFLNAEDVKNSITGIGLYGENLIIQIHDKCYPRRIQVITPCPRWLLEKYIT